MSNKTKLSNKAIAYAKREGGTRVEVRMDSLSLDHLNFFSAFIKKAGYPCSRSIIVRAAVQMLTMKVINADDSDDKVFQSMIINKMKKAGGR